MALRKILRISVVCLLLQTTGFTSSNVASAQRPTNTLQDPMIFYSTTELACSQGYSVQEHKVITEDGYVLTVHRIPNGRNRPKVPTSKSHYKKLHSGHHPDFDECINESLNQTSEGFPVVFGHAVMMASDGWLLQGPGSDLAYIMADKGYDIWLPNVRGNFYSRKHTSLSPSDPKFWNFSFHEHAMYDMPAVIDYVLKLTGQEKVGHIGFSMGTTVFFAMAAMRPEYNEKIVGSIALAPVVYIKEEYMNNRRKIYFRVLESLVVGLPRGLDESQLKARGVHELFPRNNNILSFGRLACSRELFLQDLCYDLIVHFMGHRSKLVLRDKLHLYATHFPTGTSVKTLEHYMQNIRRNSFKLFDYGTEKNLELYGSEIPPDYPLWNITIPVDLCYTDTDLYYDKRDIQDLAKVLPNLIGKDETHQLNHADYLWWYRAKDAVYPTVTSFFKKMTDQYYIEKRRKKSTKPKKS